jgi:hypothetical protein
MADRQDIDALLVSALYGELDSAESQRLEAHLASHPQDRAALEAMTHTRGRAREGLAALSSAEPQPAIHALLMQEAARRAPARKAGGSAGSGLWAWLQGAMRPMMAHPALAAAAAFVLFVGVAGAFLLRGPGNRMYEASAPPPAAETIAIAPAEPQPAPAAATAPSPQAAPPADSYEAQLAPDVAVGDRAVVASAPRPAATSKDTRLERSQTARKPDGIAKQALALEADDADRAGADAPARRRADARYLEVTTPEPELKTEEDTAAARGAVTQSESAANAEGHRQAPPAPAAAAGNAGPQTPRDYAGDAELAEKRTEWARFKHQELRAAVKRNDCKRAASLFDEIATRDRDYYSASIATDKTLTQCRGALDVARKKNAPRRAEPKKDAPASAQ